MEISATITAAAASTSFASFNVTVSNNTAFNNYIDPDQNGGSGMMDDNAGGNSDGSATYVNYFYNNIAVGCTTAAPKLPSGGRRRAAVRTYGG